MRLLWVIESCTRGDRVPIREGECGYQCTWVGVAVVLIVVENAGWRYGADRCSVHPCEILLVVLAEGRTFFVG